MRKHEVADNCDYDSGSPCEREKNATLPTRRLRLLHLLRLVNGGAPQLFDEFREARRTLRRILGEKPRQNVNPAIFKRLQKLENL